MKHSTKAALYSGLLFPGTGHFFLGRYLLGGVLVLPAFAALCFLLIYSIDKAMKISQMIVDGEVALNVLAIRSLIYADQTAAQAQQISIATTIFIIVWIVGVVDSYRIGRAMDQKG